MSAQSSTIPSAGAPGATGASSAAGGSPAASGAASTTTAATGDTSKATTTTKKKTTKKKKTTAGDGTAGDGTKKKVVRRKKPTSKASNSASNAALQSAARAALGDAAYSKALSAARRTDPLWYRIEDVLPPQSTTASSQHHYGHGNMATSSRTILPEQIQIVEAALAHNNMTRSDVTPQAMACLLEQARRYAQELVEDAQDYAAHANGMFAPPTTGPSSTAATTSGGIPEPQARDFILAAEMRPDHPQAVTAQLPKLNLLAQQVNAAPLPSIPPQCYGGVLLPSNNDSGSSILLTARTFDVVSGAHVAQKMIAAVPLAPAAFASVGTPGSPDANKGALPSKKLSSASASASGKEAAASKPGYGASRGLQIPIKLKGAEAGTAAAVTGTPTKPPASATMTTPDKMQE